MTNLNLYRIFCEVAKVNNITKASENLYISQPAVSNAIKELENQLGGQLFIRQNKGVTLSPYGKDIYMKVLPCIEKFNELENYFDDIKTLNSGVLRIGTNTSNTNQIISKYLVKFAELYPNIKIKMKRDTQENLIQELESQDLDIIYIDNESIGEFNVAETYNIEYQLIGDKNFFEKYKNNPITAENFPNDEMILPTKLNKSRKILEQHFSSINLKISPKYEVDNYKIIYDLVKNGLGMAFVNTEYYKEKIGTEVFLINSKINFIARKINAVYNKNADNPTLNQFIDVMKD